MVSPDALLATTLAGRVIFALLYVMVVVAPGYTLLYTTVLLELASGVTVIIAFLEYAVATSAASWTDSDTLYVPALGNVTPL